MFHVKQGTPMNLTEKELSIVLHALGLDGFGRGESYRRHYVVGPGCEGYDECVRLASLGMMTRRDCSFVVGGVVFSVTAEGEAAARAQAPKPPKLSRSAARYRAWLASASSRSFGDWLKTEGAGA